MKTYYYEHVNGTVHRKPAIVVEMGGGPLVYFDSPFVRRWWVEEEPPLPFKEEGDAGEALVG